MTDNVRLAAKTTPGPGNTLLLVFSSLWVGVPLILGVLETLQTSMALFR
jgi:hypothetical protein